MATLIWANRTLTQTGSNHTNYSKKISESGYFYISLYKRPEVARPYTQLGSKTML